MALDGVTSFLRLKDVTNTCKRMRRGLSIGGSSSVQRRKVGRSRRLQICFRRLLCIKIENRSAPVRDLLRSRHLRYDYKPRFRKAEPERKNQEGV